MHISTLKLAFLHIYVLTQFNWCNILLNYFEDIFSNYTFATYFCGLITIYAIFLDTDFYIIFLY